jgi:hypothetical protein
MTEAEWLACTEVRPMLDFLRGRVSERKLRLFACGCFRLTWRLLQRSQERHVIRVAELHADGACGGRKLARAFWSARSVSGGTSPVGTISWCAEAAQVAVAASEAIVSGTADPALRIKHASLFRCITGSPFRVELSTAKNPYRSDRVAAGLAQGIYGDHAFDRVPILADALEDAGCTDGDILEHLRGPGPHVRSYWALDLILGKP